MSETPRGLVTVRHNLTPRQAAAVRDELVRLWPGCDIDVKVGRRLWPFRRRLGIRVREVR